MDDCAASKMDRMSRTLRERDGHDVSGLTLFFTAPKEDLRAGPLLLLSVVLLEIVVVLLVEVLVAAVGVAVLAPILRASGVVHRPNRLLGRNMAASPLADSAARAANFWCTALMGLRGVVVAVAFPSAFSSGSVLPASFETRTLDVDAIRETAVELLLLLLLSLLLLPFAAPVCVAAENLARRSRRLGPLATAVAASALCTPAALVAQTEAPAMAGWRSVRRGAAVASARAAAAAVGLGLVAWLSVLLESSALPSIISLALLLLLRSWLLLVLSCRAGSALELGLRLGLRLSLAGMVTEDGVLCVALVPSWANVYLPLSLKSCLKCGLQKTFPSSAA